MLHEVAKGFAASIGHRSRIVLDNRRMLSGVRFCKRAA
jgi:hypothetical protein